MSYLQTFPGFLVFMAVVCLLFNLFEKRICGMLGSGGKETCETVGDYAVPAATFSGCVALMCLFLSMMGMGHAMGGMGMGGLVAWEGTAAGTAAGTATDRSVRATQCTLRGPHCGPNVLQCARAHAK